MKHARSEASPSDGVRMLYCLDELDRLRVVLLCLGESANLAEAHDQVGPIKDRCWHSHAEIFVGPIRWDRRKTICKEFDHVLVLAPIVVCLLEMACGDDAKSQVAEVVGDLQGAIAGHECLVQVVES